MQRCRICIYSGVGSVADVAALAATLYSSAASSLQTSHMQLYTCVDFRLNYTYTFLLKLHCHCQNLAGEMALAQG